MKKCLIKRQFTTLLAEELPREKFLERGKEALTNMELLALILGSGNGQASVLDVAHALMTRVEGNLLELSRFDLNDYLQIKGLGKVKAMELMAVFELGRRKELAIQQQGLPIITQSKDIYALMRPLLEDLRVEVFWVLILNRGAKVVYKQQIGLGGVSGVLVDIKVILKLAILHLGSSIVVVHNHPSGQLKASKADKELTQNIKKACQSLDLCLLDHLIISNSGYFSFADAGDLF